MSYGESYLNTIKVTQLRIRIEVKSIGLVVVDEETSAALGL
jgi:hypothetical protein